jgi:hypothetical protein
MSPFYVTCKYVHRYPVLENKTVKKIKKMNHQNNGDLEPLKGF